MNSSRARHALVQALAVLSMTTSVAGLAAVNAPAASAEPGVHDYVECPVVQRGMGCGFQALVPTGSWNVLFRYRDNDGRIQTEFDGGICTSGPCEDFTFAVPHLDRVPLGYDVYTGAPILVTNKFVRF